MRRLFNKAKKLEDKSRENLNQEIVRSKEYQALLHVNAIMNLMDAIEKLGFDPLEGPELYIHARFQVHAFMEELLLIVASQVESKSNAA